MKLLAALAVAVALVGAGYVIGRSQQPELRMVLHGKLAEQPTPEPCPTPEPVITSDGPVCGPQRSLRERYAERMARGWRLCEGPRASW